MPTMANSDPEEPKYPSSVYAWYVVGLLFIAAIISYSDRQVLSLLVDPVRHALMISDTQISLLIGAAFAMIYGVAGVPLGFLADRMSRRNLIAGGILVWSLATIGCGLVQSFGQFFTSRILVGLGEAALTPAAVSLISDYFPPGRRATALAVYFAGISVGVGSAILIGGGLLHAINAGLVAATPLAREPAWRLVFLLIGLPALLWSLMIFTIREPPRRHSHAPIVETAEEAVRLEETTRLSQTQARLSPAPPRPGVGLQLAPIFVAVAVASFVDNGVAAWAPSLFIREFHRDAAEVGVTLGAWFMIGGAAGVLTGGVWADRAAQTGGWSVKLRLCFAAMCVSIPALLLTNSGNATLVLTAVAISFFMSGAVTAAGLSAILDLTPNRRRGLATAFSFFLNVALGAGLGPTAVALAGVHVFGGRGGLGPPLLLVAESGDIVIAAAALFALHRYNRTSKANALALGVGAEP